MYVNPDVYTLLFESRYPNGKPYIVLFSNNTKPIALIIGATTRSSVPIKIGYLSTNTPELNSLDVEIDGLISNGGKEAEDVMLEFLRALLKQKKFDKLEIQHLPETHSSWNEIKSGMRVRRGAIYNTSIEWFSKIRDAETGEQISYHKPKTKRKLRRADRILTKHFDENVEVKEITSPSDIKSFIEKSDVICKKSYLCEIGAGIEDTEYWKKYLTDVAEGGYFRGYLLIANSQPISYSFGLVYKNTFYLFATAFNSDFRDISPGGYLIRRMLENLVKEKIDYFHFGFGDAEYKRLYGNESTIEATFRIYGFTNTARISKVLDQGTIAIHGATMGVLDKFGILNKVKKIWRSKLAKK
ncbi:MAG: GNAT family N-acetyltransferase [Melioribacteraceae bacterium]